MEEEDKKQLHCSCFLVLVNGRLGFAFGQDSCYHTFSTIRRTKPCGLQRTTPIFFPPRYSQTAPRQGGAAQPRPSAYPQGSVHNVSRPSSYAQAAPRVIRPGEAQNAPTGAPASAPANTPAPRTPAQTARPKPPEDDVWTAWNFDGRDGSK